MNNTITKLPAILTSSRSKSLGINELKALLNLFTDPSLLLDLDDYQIVLGNSQFFQLTSFSPLEVTGALLTKIHSQ